MTTPTLNRYINMGQLDRFVRMVLGITLIWLRRPPRSSDGPVQRSKISIEQSGHLSVYVCRFPHQTITLNFAKLKGQLLERLKGTGHALAVDKANWD